jgi:DNA-binding Lrp family transcriptional regulator
MPSVQTLLSVSGKYDIVALLRAPTTERIDELLDDIGVIEGVNDTESSIILATRLDRRWA